MTPLLMTVIVVPVILLTGAWAVGHFVGHIPAKIGVSVWIGTVTLIIVSVLAGVFLYVDQKREYDACIAVAEGRTVLDEGFGTLSDGLGRLQAALGEPLMAMKPEVAVAFTSLVNDMEKVAIDLQPLRTQDCPRPLELGW